MGAFILQLGSTIRCPHGGTASVVNTNQKLKADGSFALLADDRYTVAGCPFMIGNKPSPCLTIEWLNEAKRVQTSGKAVLLQSSTGLCKSGEGLVQGNALVSGVQTQVKGS